MNPTEDPQELALADIDAMGSPTPDEASAPMETAPAESGGYWLHSPRRLATDWRVMGGLAVVLLLLYLPGLGSYGLYDPWETHYGEVARNMVEHSDYVDPFWGSPWDASGVKRERAGFYSKPPLIMWMMAGGMNLFGYRELGVRFFFPLVALMALLAMYLAVSRFYGRRAGLIAAGITATTPFFSMLGRQAVTDGPMVAIITAGMMSLAIALFHCKEDEEATPALYWFTLGLLLVVMFGQMWAMLPMDRSPDIVRPYAGNKGAFYAVQWWISELFTVGRGKGWVLALVLSPLAVWTAARVALQRRRRMLYVYLFYIACGLTVPAKGWLGWAPMGGTIVAYLLVTGEWKILKWVDVPVGLLIVFMTGHPWIVAMLGGHHPGWYDRFWTHDHYKRLFSGVHSIDKGGFEYFIKWIGYGLFPWVGLLPGAILRVMGRLRRRAEGYTPQDRFEIFIFLWALLGFFLFSKSSTKFHHYILPVIPPLSILMALFLEDLLRNRVKAQGLLLSIGAVVLAWIAMDLVRMPTRFGTSSQNLVNLFTYKYAREWPKFTDAVGLEKLKDAKLEAALADNVWLGNFAGSLLWIAILAGVGLALMALFKGWKRRYGAAVLGVAGVWMMGFCLHDYLPKVSVHWSQKGMWDAYYSQCQKFGPDEDAAYAVQMIRLSSRVPSRPEMFPRARCKDPVVAFRTNWRGEAFYSANTVLPAPETKHLKPFLDEWGTDKPFFLFTEASRVRSELEPKLPDELKGRYEVVYGAALKFVMLRIDKRLPKNPWKK